jgi:nitroimidazol reductase NimA-like FMN-containing flavoprotein (pyridoxamine 5'-phosphate oxidase superfamily)
MDPLALTRHPERGSHERAEIAAVLDAAPLCHVAFVDAGLPFAIPTMHVRVGDAVYLHASVKSRLARVMASGAEVCLTATLLDGLVLARSAYFHSVNYRSVVVLGRAFAVVDPRERRAVLDALIERLVPGRSARVRPPSPGELAATAVVGVPLERASVKRRAGPPTDAAADRVLPVWAGVVPLAHVAGTPVPDGDPGPGAPVRLPLFGADP